MLITREVEVEGRRYPVTISDENEALSAAYAAGGALIGIWRPEYPAFSDPSGSMGSGGIDYSHCLYLVEDAEDADEKLLEKAVRRSLGLPLVIGETRRLLIREFTSNDPLEREEALDPVFCDREKRDAYIACQYRFCECGLWALVEKESGTLLGKAGITGGELGYHIYQKYRRFGYAYETCQKLLSYAWEELGLEKLLIKTEKGNLPSICLAEKLGFIRAGVEGEWLLFEKSAIHN